MEIIRNCFQEINCEQFEIDNKINYKQLKNFIDTRVMPIVSQYIDTPNYVKFKRCSHFPLRYKKF